jgi:signal transduction histidine kinase
VTTVDTTWTALLGLTAQPTAFLERLVRAAVDFVGARVGGLVTVPRDGPYVREVVVVNYPAPLADARIQRGEGLVPRVLAGRPVLVDDYAFTRTPQFLEMLPSLGPVALLPFTRDGGEVYAYVQVASFAGSPPFDRAAVALLGELIKRVNPLLPSILALRQAHRGLAVHEAAARMLDGLRRVQDIAELARRAVDGLGTSLGLGAGVVVLTTPDGGFEIAGRPESVRVGPLEQAAIEDGLLVIGPGRDTCLGLDREVAVLPLAAGDAVLGALVIAQRGPLGHFWPEELGWIERYAVRLALGIQYLRDREAQAARIDAYQRLLEGVRLISAEHELDEVLQRLVDVAIAACHARCGAVYMLDVGAGMLRQRTHGPAERASELPTELRPGEGAAGRAFAEGRTLKVRAELAADGGRLPPADSATLATPVRVGDDRVGVLMLSGASRGPLLTAANVEHLELVAAHAGTAVAAARRIEALRHTEEHLRRHVAEVEEYADMVSHDLSTPVVSVSGLTTILLDDYGDALPQGARALVERIRRAADHLALISGDLASYSQLGREGGEPEEVELLPVLREVLARIGRRVGLVDAVELPATGARLWIVRDHLQRLAENAITHGLRAAGQVEAPRLRVTLGGDEVSVLLRFDDNGAALAPEQRERAFELFRRGDTGSGSPGIGLAAVRRCAELAGGAAWIEPGTLGGSCLCVRLPRA